MSTPDLSSPEVPAGLPDVATLARLAGEFFAELPGSAKPPSVAPSTPSPALGSVSLPVNAHPAGFSLPPGVTGPSTPSSVPFGAVPPGANLAPTSPQSPANAAASSPALVPHAQAGNGVPDHALVAAPGHDGRVGSHVLGVPEAHGANAPAIAAPGAGVTAPSSPYYFVGEPNSARIRNPSPAVSPADDRVTAQSFGLPGDDALRTLLQTPSEKTLTAPTTGQWQLLFPRPWPARRRSSR